MAPHPGLEEVYRWSRGYARGSLGTLDLPAELRAYTADPANAPATPCSRETLLELLGERSIVLIGDFHSDPASQEAALALIASLAAGPRPVVLALEAVPDRLQESLGRYLKGTTEDPELFGLLEDPGVWGFSTGGLRPLLQLARMADLPVLALDDRPAGLEQRDGFMARRLLESLAHRPDHLHLALVGESHLSPDHLPAKLQQMLGHEAPAPLTVWVNDARCFEQGLSSSELLSEPYQQLGPHTVNLQTASPLEKWVSADEDPLRGLDHEGRHDPEPPIQELAARLAALADLPSPSFEEWHVFVGDEIALEGFLEARNLPIDSWFEEQARSAGAWRSHAAKVLFLRDSSLSSCAAAAMLSLAALQAPRRSTQGRHALAHAVAVAEFGRLSVFPRRSPRNRERQVRNAIQGSAIEAVTHSGAVRFGELLGHRLFWSFAKNTLTPDSLRAFLQLNSDDPQAFLRRWRARLRGDCG